MSFSTTTGSSGSRFLVYDPAVLVDPILAAIRLKGLEDVVGPDLGRVFYVEFAYVEDEFAPLHPVEHRLGQ